MNNSTVIKSFKAQPTPNIVIVKNLDSKKSHLDQLSYSVI